MKKFLKAISMLIGIGSLILVLLFSLLPWMDRWGATDAEIAASLPGDELIPSPRLVYTRAVSIDAAPEQIYPWIAQLGADKGGMYSYTWIIDSFFLAAQHMFLPLILNGGYLLWRFGMFLPFALFTGLVIKLRPALLPYFVIVHALLDVTTVLVYMMI